MKRAGPYFGQVLVCFLVGGSTALLPAQSPALREGKPLPLGTVGLSGSALRDGAPERNAVLSDRETRKTTETAGGGDVRALKGSALEGVDGGQARLAVAYDLERRPSGGSVESSDAPKITLVAALATPPGPAHQGDSEPSSHSRGSSNISLPWVQATNLGTPELFMEKIFDVSPVDLSPCALFEEEQDKSKVMSRPPSYAKLEPLPLFYVPPPRETEFSRRMSKFLREKMYREIRRKLKQYWKALYQDHPSMTNAFYEERLLEINSIGKDPRDYDEFNVEYRTNEAKQDVFRRKRREGEPDLELFNWGPLTVTDSGGIKFDLGAVTHVEEVDEKLKVGEEKRKPFLATKDYRIETSVNIDIDPFRGYQAGDAFQTLRRYGFTIGVNWLSDVLGREMVTTELEFEANTRGDFGVFANIVIKSR